MTGTALLTRSISKAAPASGTVTFTAGSSSKSVTIYVVQLTMITPAGDPVAAPVQSGDGQNEFTFSPASTGVLTMNLKARAEPAGCASKIRTACHFTVEAIGDSTMAWATANPGGVPTASVDDLLATATFTTLPTNNGAFGKKKAAIYCAGTKADEENYEVFFMKNETNHPGGQAGSWNWYYYWSQTAAGAGFTNTWVSSGSSGYTAFESGAWRAYIGQAAGHTAGGTWGNAAGIDLFANICRHEDQHRLDLIAQWGETSGRVPSDDIDGDYMKDPQEATIYPGRPYDKDLEKTYIDTFGYNPSPNQPLRDVEDYALWRQPKWSNGSANHLDWANPGMQHATLGNPDN